MDECVCGSVSTRGSGPGSAGGSGTPGSRTTGSGTAGTSLGSSIYEFVELTPPSQSQNQSTSGRNRDHHGSTSSDQPDCYCQDAEEKKEDSKKKRK